MFVESTSLRSALYILINKKVGKAILKKKLRSPLKCSVDSSLNFAHINPIKATKTSGNKILNGGINNQGDNEKTIILDPVVQNKCLHSIITGLLRK
jgi:hypothetical protein